MSDFIVSARKYRPKRFDEVVGQHHVTETLKNSISNEKLAHAFLFTGPRGVGKTTSARILAKAINCTENADTVEPCGTCESCINFEEHASFNIIELDAASNNSVEHIRSLVDQVKIPPQKGAYRVFIIDEVHMLSTAAFNAFLKTLEEPPSYAVFILATTEKHKILPTILSRCQIFDFKRIQVEDILEHLKQVAEKENISYDEEALYVIGRKADGALRDALSIFDRLANFGDAKISYQNTIEILNVLDYDVYFETVERIRDQKLDDLLNIFDRVLNNGHEGQSFVLGLLDHLRALLICKFKTIEHLLDLSESVKKRYYKQAQELDKDFLLTLLDIGHETDVQYKIAENKRLHVEMGLIKMAYYQNAVEIASGGEKKKS